MLATTEEQEQSLINRHAASQPNLHAIESADELELTNEHSISALKITANDEHLKTIKPKKSMQKLTSRRVSNKGKKAVK